MSKSGIVKSLLIFIAFFCFSQLVTAQDILKPKDLSQVRVDQLSDADIAKFNAQLNSGGLTLDQAEQIALSKGMPVSEFAKLRQRSIALSKTNQRGITGTDRSREPASSARRKVNSPDSLARETYGEPGAHKPLIDSLIFGSSLYTSIAPNFEPNLNLATPLNYVLGPSDEIAVSVYGIQQYEGTHVVSTEGNITIPSIGQVKVGGLTIENATAKLKTLLGNSAYRYLKTGEAKLSITLTKIRTIRVNVIGSNFPGNFNVSSLATVFNVLYLAGGPTEFGSFREIELIRNGKPERKIDLYRFLLNGDQSDNIGLKDNDVIRIPTYKKRAQLKGQVKRPGIFEILPGEKFSNLLAFASGFTDTAYKASLKVFQAGDKERKIFDLYSSSFNDYEPQSGDVIVVSKILNRYENRVRITGAVMRPDVYELTPGLTLRDLIKKADGLREDAFTRRGQIVRLKEDLTRSVLSFDVRKALAGEPADNVALQREDEVFIGSVQELRDSLTVNIDGEIRMPGQYEYVQNLTLKDLILMAGGLTDAALGQVEIVRLLKKDSLVRADAQTNTIIITTIDSGLNADKSNVLLEPFDVVIIRRKAGYFIPNTVTITGQIQFPGPYGLGSSSERISNLIKRAGGVTSDAFFAGAYLKRRKTAEEMEAGLEALRSMKYESGADSSALLMNEVKEYDKVPIDLVDITAHPGSINDLFLRPGDELIIPKFDDQVKIKGAVLLTTQIPFRKQYDLDDYISAAGGFSGNAWRNKAFVVYANGKAATTKKFLFFKSYPRVEPGSTVIVPVKPAKKGISAAETIGMASAIASLASVVIALISL